MSQTGILYVDDEVKSLQHFKEMYSHLGPIFLAPNGEEGIRVFEENHNQIGVVVSDKIMPGMNGLEFLKRIRDIDGLPLRMLITVNTDLQEAVAALNESLIYSYLPKPWDPTELEIRLKRSLDRFWINREKKSLLKNRAASFQSMMMAERAASLETLSVGLNHHMRTALTAIQAYFDMIPIQLEQEIDGNPPKDSFFWGEYYQTVSGQVGQIQEVLDNLAEGTGVHQSDAGLDVKTINLSEIAREVGNAETACEPHITFTYHGVNIVNIQGDEPKLLRLLSGLIQEAKRNIGEAEGTIEIVIEPKPSTPNEEPMILIKCRDDSALIDEGERQRLFDPFYIRKNRPAEIDVSLLACYFIAFQHGGTIAANAENDKNTIQLLLPYSRSTLDKSQVKRDIVDKLSPEA